MKLNALCSAEFAAARKRCDAMTACGIGADSADGKIKAVTPFEIDKPISGDIYIGGLLDENVLEHACDYLFESGNRAIVRAAYDLDEAGLIEARYKLSPIMLLHKLGIIDKCTVAGGVCLDNDDLDLMAQENVPLILLPTADAGYGHGYAPVCAAIRRGIRVGIGTFDCKYNRRGDLDYELDFLRLTANAEMRTENALGKGDIERISAFE